jgi:deazaflavin-dependent oxidoreductase (nitroreductase family)
MPAPRWLARANRYMMNPVFRRVAPHAPGFGVIVHRGRKSGQEYRTPVNVFPNDGGYVVALTYGRESEWVRNVLANGGCTLVTRGKSIPLNQPRLIHDETRKAVPAHIRPGLGLLKVNDFLELQRVGDV